MDFTKAFYSGNALLLIFTLDFNALILIRTTHSILRITQLLGPIVLNVIHQKSLNVLA